MSTPLIRAWYAIAVSFGACVIIAVSGVAYTNHVQQQADKRSTAERAESDRRWCALLVEISKGQRESPPKTESGKRFADEIDQLRREFGCPAPS